jgi:serine/threonine protein kinase
MVDLGAWPHINLEVNAGGELFRREPGTLGGVAVSGERKPSISDFALVRVIGRGSYGDVWLARSLTGVYRAIKIVFRDRFADSAPFEREFNGLKRFMSMSLPESGHLALLHVGQNEADGYFYYVMELADDLDTGRDVDPELYRPLTLKELLGRRKRIPAGECVPIAVELTRALASLHLRGLVHRDIKPSNIIIVGGLPKLADIGLVASSTDARTFVGTEGYVPPEGPGKPSADVFALGKVVYELSTGLGREDYPRLPEELREFPDREAIVELNEVILRACDLTESRRYPDGSAMLEDLLELQSGNSLRLKRARARTAKFAAGLALALGFAAVASWWILHRSPPGPIAPSDAGQLVARAWEQMNKTGAGREELEFAEGFCKRATELEPLDADAWAAWSQVNSMYCMLGIDTGLARREAARSDAERALNLAPDSRESRLAQASYLTRLEPAAFAPEANRMLLQLILESPHEPRALNEYARLQYGLGHPQQARTALMRLVKNPNFGARAWLSLAYMAEDAGDKAGYIKAIDRSISVQPYESNLRAKLWWLVSWQGDLDAADSLLKTIPASIAQSDAMLPAVFRLYYFRREPERALDYLHGIPRDWFTGGDDGPVRYFIGFAQELAGRKELARIEWQEALKLVEGRLSLNPTSRHLLAVRVRLLIYLGEYAEAEKSLQLSAEAREDVDWVGLFTLRMVEGQEDAAMDIKETKLPGFFDSAAVLRLDPEFDPLRSNARFKAELARAEADPKRSPHVHPKPGPGPVAND